MSGGDDEDSDQNEESEELLKRSLQLLTSGAGA
jgi:hypothetical protein